MASTVVFDTHQYVKKLVEAGGKIGEAEVQAEALKELIENNLATKRDLEDLKKDLTIRLGAMLGAGIGILSILITILNKLH